MEIKIRVRQKICTDYPDIVLMSNNRTYTVTWDLDDEWQPYDTKTMRVISLPDGAYQDIVFTGKTVSLPSIPACESLSVGLFAGDTLSSGTAGFSVRRSVLAHGGSPLSAEQDVYAQIMEHLNQWNPDSIPAAVETYLLENPPAGVSMQVAGDKIQYSTDGQAWTDLVSLEALRGSDASVTAANIAAALGYTPARPADIPADAVTANTKARHSHGNKSVLDDITGQVTAAKLGQPDHSTDLVQYAAFQLAAQQILSAIPTVPETLPSPAALTIRNGSTAVSYDGSSAKEFTVPELVEYTTVTAPAYVNQIPHSTGTDGNVYNGAGFKIGTSLNSTGAETDGSTVVSGFIPVKKGDVIRIRDVSQASVDTSLMVALYGAGKAVSSGIGKTIGDIQGNAAYGALTVSGSTITWDTSGIGYWFWNDFAYLRVTAHSADAVVTVNEELTEVSSQKTILKPQIRIAEENLDFSAAKPMLHGKKVVIFGDSLIGMTRDSSSVPAYAAAMTGADICNVGFGGCRMSTHPTAGYAAFSMWALADAVSSGTYTLQDAQAASGQDYFSSQLALLKSIRFSDVHAAVIHYGTNDFAAGIALEGSTDDDTSAVCGALRYTLGKLQAAYPRMRIFISTPLYRKWDQTGAESYRNSQGKTLEEYGQAIAAVARSFNCPVIDGYHALGINAATMAAYSDDGTHLNDYGRRIFGELIGGNLISPVSG